MLHYDLIYDTEKNEFYIGDIPFPKYNRKKGKSLLEFPLEYVVIDVETNGLSSMRDYIIELSAVKVSNGKIIDTFSTLVKPDEPTCYDDDEEDFDYDDDKLLYVDKFTTNLTGITNEMLSDAPLFKDIIDDFLNFLGDSIIVGHNVNFDINFIYDSYYDLTEKFFKNNFCDLLRITKKIFSNFRNYKLPTVASELGVEIETSHRALADCITTYRCFEKCREYALNNNIALVNSKTKKVFIPHIDSSDVSQYKSKNSLLDNSHPLYSKVCVFTGTLERLSRGEAAQLVVNIGGICENRVTNRTNYLILGNKYTCSTIKDGKSTKQKKAEELMLKGQDIQIMPEDTFYDLILEHMNVEDKGE